MYAYFVYSAKSISVGAIVGLVLALLFVVMFCGVCVYFVVQKQKRRPGQTIRPIHNTQTVSGKAIQRRFNTVFPFFTRL